MDYEITRETKFGNLHRIYFRKPDNSWEGYSYFAIQRITSKKGCVLFRVTYGEMDYVLERASTIKELLERLEMVEIYKAWKKQNRVETW